MNHNKAVIVPLVALCGGLFCGTTWAVAKPHLTPEVHRQCLAILRAGLNSSEFWPSIHAAEALTLAGRGKEVQEHLEPLLSTETDDQKRCGIARELVRAGDASKSLVMMEILQKKDSRGHVHAAESLYKVGWIGRDTPIRKAFSETDDIRRQIMAAAALAKHGSGPARERAFVFLRQSLANERDPAIFRLSAWVLGRMGTQQDCKRIRARLKDAPDALVRAFLQHALAALGDPQGSQAVIKNLDSNDPAIRTYAAVFAGESKLIEARPLLLRQLDDENLDARIRAAQALILLAR